MDTKLAVKIGDHITIDGRDGIIISEDCGHFIVRIPQKHSKSDWKR